MPDQTIEHIVPLHQAASGNLVDRTCSFCGNHLLFVDYDETQNTAILACPHWVATQDNLHDSFSIPLDETECTFK